MDMHGYTWILQFHESSDARDRHGDATAGAPDLRLGLGLQLRLSPPPDDPSLGSIAALSDWLQVQSLT